MSHLNNPNSFDNANNRDFVRPTVQPSEPMRNDGHQLARKVAPADYKPEFRAETHPPGTAPASNSYIPNTTAESGNQAMNPLVERSHGKEAVKTSAEQTLTGATSKDVHKGLGHPGSGQTNNEIKHEGAHHRKHNGSGLEGVGSYRQDKFERRMPEQRGIEREEAQSGHHGDKGVSAAEDIPPQSAETVASGR
ncbi:uncharacterized protein ACLA_018550 [Aspergillus clavatus NRRL 1]|uniref:Uncharacterized protein n=1 Tax=Aspergillus clavatus (strain ATCC 1007 / CBS 513.65 / DSM 816 / NCTC 3887 / NRRL 1 / QM 1276 / 107) TaxID=344612 RepID=A1CND0_ASPCL|nr:uncharacterized protein ACLA_018550 [Aspergillus clavatus NRRL 1]EAW07151.1 conserved hypothetical protein [Aspergillus clavatus NRRL 1]